jgi:fructose-1,6-bisphosphatase/inositol monophosphatase family enzyme
MKGNRIWTISTKNDKQDVRFCTLTRRKFAMGRMNYGLLNPHAIGIIMKEMVRRAIEEIRAKQLIFEATSKRGYSGNMDDVVTDVDRVVQGMYAKLIRESFPNYGIIAEENNLRVECTKPLLGDAYFTVDPLDGTKAYVRRQSHGIGTMISLVQANQIVAAYVGDIMTREIFGYRPEATNVYRISEYGHGEKLAISIDRPLSTQRLLLCKMPSEHSTLMRRIIKASEKNSLFRGHEIANGSIGTTTARIWKGEVGAMIFSSEHITPWDINPVMGISEKLGFVCFIPSDDGTTLVQTQPYRLSKEITHNAPNMLMIHESRVQELLEWQRAHITG